MGYVNKDMLQRFFDGCKLTFSAKDHVHTFGSINGTLPVSKGGTGSTSVAGGRSGLGAVAFVCQKAEPSGQNNGDLWFAEE